MGDSKELTELQQKVDKIVELTRATRDEAVVALHDCDDQLDKAIDMILEGESVNAEWRSAGKKRKPKSAASGQTASGSAQESNDDKINSNDTASNDKKGASNRGRGPRLQRGGGAGKVLNRKREDKSTSDNRENDENTAPDEPNANAKGAPSRGRGSGDPNRRARGRGGPTRGSFTNNRGASSRGPRMFSNKGYRNTINSASATTNDGFPNSIDTWTNSTAEQVNSNSKPPAAGATMSVGNWSDFVGTEDWSEEDWDSSLMETKVFTPSTKAVAEKESISDITSNASQGLNFSTLLSKQASEASSQHGQQPITSILGSNVPRSTSASSAGAALLQQLQQGVSSPSQINKFSLSQYTKQATENIKSLVGIPPTSYSTNNQNMINTDTLESQVNELSSRQIESQNEVNQQGSLNSSKSQPPRLQKMRSKIPESAVEMPSNDSISALNVQFGALPFDLGSENSKAFHDIVNHVKSSSIKSVPSGTISAASGSTSSASAALLSAAVSDNAFRNASKNSSQPGGVKTSSGVVSSASDLVLQSSVLAHQSLPSELSGLRDRSKNTSAQNSYGPKSVLENAGSTNESNLYQTGVSSQQGDSNAYGFNVTYGAASSGAPYVYSLNTNNQNAGVVYPTTAYRTQTTTSHAAVLSGSSVAAGQKQSSIKDLDSSGSSQHKHTYDLQGVSNVNPGAGGSLGLVSNSTVTTNVLKNSLTATGKGIPNVPQGVPPLLGTQYIMGQAGLSGLSFYPFYDVQIPTPHGRDHNFAYSTNTDLKYSRADNDGSNTVSTQSPVSQTHNQAIFGQIPHGYSFFYTPAPGVNMMPQSLYGPPAPIFPVPATNAHTGSTASGFPKGTSGYGSHSYATAPYDSLATVPPPSEFVKTNAYAPSAGQQPVKGINTSTASDLSVANAMYGKNHPQLNKTYDKGNFQSTATPPPFNIAGPPQANALGSTYAPTPSQYIQMLPQTQPSMLHHSLQADATQSVASGVGGQRTLSQTQKSTVTNSKQYYWN